MKKIYFLPFLFLTIGMLTSSCKKDKDNTENSFSLNGENLSLSKGFIEAFGDNGNGTNDVDITLTSSEISYTSDFSGTGNLVYLDLNTTATTGLKAGTYNYSTNREDFTLVDATIGKNIDTATFTGEVFTTTGGSVTIAIDGTQYTFDFNLTLSNGQTVTGNYKGILQPI